MIRVLGQTKITLNELPKEPLVHEFSQGTNFISKKVIISSVVIIIIAGIASGYLLSKRIGTPETVSTIATNAGKSGSKTAGTNDTKNFPDTTEGTLEANGIDGEGTHKLIKQGGGTQTVYLTSSLVDLNQFLGKKVKVWGQTFAAQKAGWFMDVGKVEVLE